MESVFFGKLDPALVSVLVDSDIAAGNDVVNMGMVQKILSPDVQYAEKTHFRAPILRIARKLLQSHRGRLEKDVVEQPLVVQRQIVRQMGNCENCVVVVGRQKLAQPLLQPFVFGRAMAFRATCFILR